MKINTQAQTRQMISLAPKRSFTPVRAVQLQRKCACGEVPGPSGECESCRKKRLSLQRATRCPDLGTQREPPAPPISDQMGMPGREAEPGIAWNFAKIPVFSFEQASRHQTSSLFAQPKLAIGRVDDPLERDSERIADHIMRMPDPDLSVAGVRSQLVGKRTVGDERLRRDAVSPAALDGRPAPAVVHQVLAEPGRPLDSESRAFFEPRLGLDLAHVRVHDNSRAASSARAVGARAYTVGSHIVFAEGAHTASEGGRRLLAHELVHVMQQTGDAAPQLARDDAPYTPSGASGALAVAVDKIAEYRIRAATALARSGLAAADVARINLNLAACAAGELRLRSVAQAGDDAASAAVLAAFTLDGMRQVIPHLTRVRPTPEAVAVNEAGYGELAAMPAGSADLSHPIEREAERVANELVPTGALAQVPKVHGVLRRYLSAQDAQQIEQAAATAAPAIAAGAAATAAAAATAPLWVWVVVAVVVVAVAAAALYWVFSDAAIEAVPVPVPVPVPKPKPAPDTRRREPRRERCPVPENELTEFMRWGSRADGSRAAGGWAQELVGATLTDWTGCEVFETGTVDDQCWVEGSPCRREEVIDPAGRWTCSGNEWGLDWVGTGEDCVNYYQQHSQLPCRITAYQTMHMETDLGPLPYKHNVLFIEIHSDKIVSSRDDELEERPWPPR
jgi:hypothetical protein